MSEARVPDVRALRWSAVSVLLGNAALIAGIIVSTVYGLGSEALPLTTPDGVRKLGTSAGAYQLRELLWLAYPILILPQMIALYSLFRDRAPALLWPLVFWCVGLTLGIAVDVVTAALPQTLGVAYLTAPADAQPVLVALGKTISHAVLLGQVVCDNLSGTLVYPFFAVVAWRAGFISRALALTVTIASLFTFVGYRGLNYLLPAAPSWISLFGLGFYGLIWWDIAVSLKLLRIRNA